MAGTDAPTVNAEPAAVPRHWLASWFGVPLLIYGASRLAQVALLIWMSSSRVPDRLLRWDGGFYLSVAEHGYPHGYSYDDTGLMVGNSLAFFPGFPALIRLVHEVTRIDYGSASLIAAWLAAAAAAVAVYALGTRLYDARVGTALCVLFCAQPMSVVLSMGYSEGLFVALAAAALLAAHSRAWLTAGGLALAAGLTRPTGVALAAAVAVAALIEIRRPTGPRWRPAVAAGLALAGVPAYLTWVALRVGNWHAWFDIQTAGWNSTFDFGADTWAFVTGTLRTGDTWVPVSAALLLVLAVLLLGALVAGLATVPPRVWPPLVVFGLLAFVLVAGQSGYFHSKARLLVPVFALLVPAAVALGRARRPTAALVLGGYAAFGLWYGAYMITVWPYAI